jgi:hypothetical protein
MIGLLDEFPDFVRFENGNMYLTGNLIFDSQDNLPMWLLTSNIMTKCMCRSNYDTSLDGPVLIDGDLTVNGYICAKSVVNTLVSQSIELRSGSTYWDIHIDDEFSSNPSLVFGNTNGEFVRFDNSNMYINGPILFSDPANVPKWFLKDNVLLKCGGDSNFETELLGPVHIDGDLIVKGHICATNIVNTMVTQSLEFRSGDTYWDFAILDENTASPQLAINVGDREIVRFDSSSNMYMNGNLIFNYPDSNFPFYMLMDNVLNKCLCGSNYDTHLEGPVLVDGDLTVNGNLCAQSIINTFVTQHLELRSGLTYWDFEIIDENTATPQLSISAGDKEMLRFDGDNMYVGVNIIYDGKHNVPYYLLTDNVLNKSLSDSNSFDNKLNGPVWVEGDLSVNGNICATSIVNTFVTQHLELRAGTTYWDFSIKGQYTDAPVLTIASHNGTFISFSDDGDTFTKRLVIDNTWKEYVDARTSNWVFQCHRGPRDEISDNFAAETLNFTGKHRCKLSGRTSLPSSMVGKIVCSRGRYLDLDGKPVVSIDEAIPIVKLASKKMDPRAFGVIGGFEKHGRFQIGNISFIKKKMAGRVIVQSQGEGALWVCNANGSLKNGDYITSSGIGRGTGMRQWSSVKHNYTIAKITCDCTFDTSSEIYVCRRFKHKGRKYKMALVGCVYCF